MGIQTGIDWCDSTWGVLRGCSPVSDGCKHCYAANMAHRFGNPGHPFIGLTKTSGQFTGNVQFVEKHLLDPLKWGPCHWYDPDDGEIMGDRPRRIFVDSMSDLFHENVTDEMRDQIFAVMALCPQHIFQILTKRPERMLAYFTKRECPPEMKSKVFSWSSRQAIGLMGLGICMELAEQGRLGNAGHVSISGELGNEGELKVWPLPNVWLGVSVENQAAADERIPLLLQMPAAKRFVSCEPLLGTITLNYLQPSDPPVEIDGLNGTHGVLRPHAGRNKKLDWVICGGESGPGARPMHPDWARGLRDQCAAAGVPFFFKSWGEWGRLEDHRGLGWTFGDKRTGFFSEDAPGCYEWNHMGVSSHGAHMLRIGKKAAGSLLDGKEYKDFPEVTA